MLVGLQNGDIACTDLKICAEKKKPIDLRFLEVAEALAT
jgi:hypothetical protein